MPIYRKVNRKNGPDHDIVLTENDKQKIKRMFFGPYKKAWYKNGIVDNSDSAIGKRLKIPERIVAEYTSYICERHFRRAEIRNRMNDQI